MTSPETGDSGGLFSNFDQLLAIENPDAAFRRVVELARDKIGLVRVSIYVIDECRHMMLGTWSSDSNGAILDEHHVMYAKNSIDREAFRADEQGTPYTVFEGCFIVEHQAGVATAVGRGWVACTPIRCGQTIIGMMFNDTGPSHTALDEAKQAQAAILCSLLGATLRSLAGTSEGGTVTKDRLPKHRLVMSSVAMLARDPGVELTQLAQRLAVGPRRLARIFEASLGVSLPEYRNRLRLDRVAFLIAKGRTSLPDAAIAAGFDSYEQCRRAFRTFRWMALLKRLQT